MALVLKTGKTFQDPTDSTAQLTDVYGVIDSFKQWDKKLKIAEFEIRFYKNSDSRDAMANPIKKWTHTVRGDLFDTCFGNDVVSAEGENPIKKAYEYALMDKHLVRNEDGDIVPGDLIWEDFESDVS